MQTVAKTLNRHFAENEDKPAIYLQLGGQDDLPISYARLFNRSVAYAELYARRRIESGEVIVLILEHGEPLIYAFFGAILHGAIPSIMPFLTEKLSPERYRADLSSLLSITQPKAIITYAEFEAEVRAAAVNSSVREILLTTEASDVAQVDYRALKGMEISSDAIALLQHSSGTTGLQKGVALSHTAIFNQIESYRSAIRLTDDDIAVSWLPLYHDMGLIAGYLMPILCGVPLVLMSPFDWVRAPQKLLQAVSRYRGTLSWLPNFAYNFCAQKIRARHIEGVDLSSWRAVINCSEPVRWESHELFYEKFKPYGLKRSALQTSYAMAENVFGVTQSNLDDGPQADDVDRDGFFREHVARPPMDGKPSMRMLSSGRPLSNTEIRVVSDHGHELSERQVGEICLRSDSMLSGYYHRPDATAKSIKNGWYFTGDLGYIANGELFVTGRKKDMIIVGGKNIYPQDIESLAYQVGGVQGGRAAAIGVFDETQGTEDVVLIVETELSEEQRLNQFADEIRRHVNKNSAVALRIVYFVEPKWLLKTSSGKIARAANREKYMAEIEARKSNSAV